MVIMTALQADDESSILFTRSITNPITKRIGSIPGVLSAILYMKI